ncbi:CDP-alcohol phosphatidyltransferase family protein [Nostocoides sp. HKS02]|nr:CDP-alcohol phosphatidyltransferase family protein [Tetrasphaera sp. HKS02]
MPRLGPADRVTLTRAGLAMAVAALAAGSKSAELRPSARALLVSVCAVALVLDGVDGAVARRTGTATPLGARFDLEVDAFLILVLSTLVARTSGSWVLLIGTARYLFVVAGWGLPWMRRTLAPRFWRKVVAATQGVVLTAATAQVGPPWLTTLALLAALGLLAESFGRDTWWLWVRRDPEPHPAARQVGQPDAALIPSGDGDA